MRIFIFLLWPSLMLAQLDHEVYVDLSADANKLLQLVDNPRTEVDHSGLDFDVELGIHRERLGFYIFYGRFEAAKYQNYGFGMDYYLIDRERLDMTAGIGISRILRKLPIGANDEREAWADAGGWASYQGRLTGVFWLLEDVGLSGRLQYQARGDIEVHGILEGAIGIRIKFDRS